MGNYYAEYYATQAGKTTSQLIAEANANNANFTSGKGFIAKALSGVTDFNLQDAAKDAFTEFLNSTAGQAVNDKYNEILNGKSFSWMKQKILESYTNGGVNINKVLQHLQVNNSEYNIAVAMYNFFLPLGIIMVTLYCLLDIINISTSRAREFDIKNLFMSLFKATMGYAFLQWGTELFGYLVVTANDIITATAEGSMFGGTITANGNREMNEYYTRIVTVLADTKSMFTILGLFVTSLVIQIAQIVPQVVILFQAISRKIEIIYRIGLAPISLPDIYNGFSHSKALTYVKRFAVVMIHGAIMIAIIKISYQIETQHSINMIAGLDENALPSTSTVLESTLYGYAAMGLIASCKSAISDAIGC